MAEQIPEPKDERPGTVGGLSSSFPPQEFYTPFEMALSLRVGEVDNKLVRLEATQEKFATKSDIETVVKAAVAELKKDIVDVRTELKTELKKDIVDVRTELKKDIAGISTKFWAATGVFVALFIALFTSIVLLTGAVNKSLGASEALHALVVRDVPAVTPTPDRLDPAPPTEASSLPVPGNAPSGTPGTERVTGL